MLELLYATGVRVSELIALNTGDVDLKRNNVRCAGKNSRVRVIPIDRHIAQIVKEYIDIVRPELLNNKQNRADREMPDNKKLVQQIEQALLAVDQIEAERLIGTLTDKEPIEIVESIIVPAMEAVGQGWEAGTVALSQIYMSARICEKMVDQINLTHEPLRQPQPTMAIAVLEDYHMLGKRIIHSVMRGAGYQIEDLGRVDADELVDIIEERQFEVVLISTLMLRSALRVSYLRELIEHRNLQTTLIVGGAPFRFDANLWKEVGADATATGATELLPLISQLVRRAA